MRELKIEELELVAGGLLPQEENKPPKSGDLALETAAARTTTYSLANDPQEQNIPPK